MPEALLIVDVQRDFLPGGALAVPGGDEVIEVVNALAHDPRFALIIATRDWHPSDHQSFVAQGGPWPAHCVRDSPGAEIDDRVDLDAIDAVIDKGMERRSDGYSGFETGELRELLRQEQVDAVTIVGVATDVCVKHTADDALRAGLRVTIHADGVRGIDPQAATATLRDLAERGAVVR